MGICNKIIGLFTKKPQSLGEGLARVKKTFNACGDDLAKLPGERLYRTPSGNLVSIHQPDGACLNVQKHIMPCEQINSSEYIGKPAYLGRNYRNTVIGDTKVELNRGTQLATFAEKPESNLASFFRRNFTNKHRVYKEYCYPNSIQKLYPELGETGKLLGNYTTLSSNTRIIPYTKAVSMGLKV